MKRFSYYFIWTLAIGFILYAGMQLQSEIAERSQTTYQLFPLYLYIALFPVFIGILIRTPVFLLQLKERESWSFDWIKFAAIGMPALYLVVMSFLPFSGVGQGWLPVPQILLIGGTTIPTIAGVVFGYMVLESFVSVKVRGNAPFTKKDQLKIDQHHPY